jgi:Cu(I)-responsive transcriptional regulator
MNIGTAARKSGLPAKTIRYYEDIGLIAPDRAGNGYRDYSSRDVHMLGFVQHARGLGFSVAECRQLLALYRDTGRASADVKALTVAKIAEIDRKLKDLTALRNTLSHLAAHCHGDDRPDCPILEGIAEVELPASNN